MKTITNTLKLNSALLNNNEAKKLKWKLENCLKTQYHGSNELQQEATMSGDLQ